MTDLTDLDERKLAMMKSRILKLEKANVLNKSKRDKTMVEEITKIITEVESMRMEGSF